MEARSVYQDNRFCELGNDGNMWRTVHLGQDLWAPHNTCVYAPLSGDVVIAVDNIGEGNYGPTLVLRHSIGGHKFYTLYGHLSRNTLKSQKVGNKVKAGDKIGEIGNELENGGWLPHLHFQLLRSLWGNTKDFPGVAYFHEYEIMKSACPNPGYITGFMSDRIEQQEVEIFKDRKRLLGPSLSVSYREPLRMVRGYKQYLYDYKGRKYLDTVNNVAHVGHEHPRVVNAIRKQAAVLNTNTRYLHPHIVEFAEKLSAKFPDPLSVCYFVNSGSEANELAMRIARTVSENDKMLAIEMGYHGNTAACIDVSSYKFDSKGGAGKPENTILLSSPDPFRNPIEIAALSKELDRKVLNTQLAGFIGESILSCAGQIVPPPKYFKQIYSRVRENGGLCIADEVQVGFGRVGEAFWGFELHGVIPDIVTMGKPIGNGHPLGAVITTKEIADEFANGMEYFNTFGGNPVSCAVGLEVLSIIEDEQLQEHAKSIGRIIEDDLNTLQKDFPIIADIRGSGLFLGFELINQDGTPATRQASYLVNRMRDRAVLMSSDGPFENVIKVKPPLCIEESDVVYMMKQLHEVLSEQGMNF